MAARWRNDQGFTIIVEGFFLFRVCRTGEGVRDGVLGGGDPSRNHAEVLVNLFHGQPPRHLETSIFTGATFGEKPETSLIIGVNCDVLAFPLGGPKVESHHVCHQFQIGDAPLADVIRYCAGEVLMKGVIVTPESWFPLEPAVGRGIERDVNFRFGDQE